MSDKYNVAVHLVTESSDHYNMLVEAVDFDELLGVISNKLSLELQHISQHYFSTNIPNVDKDFSSKFQEYIESLWEDEE